MTKERKFGPAFLNSCEDDGLDIILMFPAYSHWSANRLRMSPHGLNT